MPIEYPTYSPNMNACDYALWDEVGRRMSEQVAPKRENREGLRRLVAGVRFQVRRCFFCLDVRIVFDIVVAGCPQATPGQPSVLIFTITQPSTILHQA